MLRGYRPMTKLILSIILLGFWSVAGLAASRPNIVVILLDDARIDDLTTMPGARSISDSGVSFNNMFSPFPLCCPARATLLTGQYAHNHGVQSNKRPTGGFWSFQDSQTLATWLNPTYVTAWTGKYFNEYGTSGSATYVPPGWNEWFTPDGSVWNYAATRWNWNGTLKTFSGQYQADTEADFVVSFINRHASSAEPIFLVASFLAPHAGNPTESDDPNIVYKTNSFPTPYVAPRHKDFFSNLPLTFNPAFNEDNSDKPQRPAALTSWEIDALIEVNQQRRESLLAVDEAIQRIITALEDAGTLENTFVMLLSDNGYALGEHRFRAGKLIPYDVAVKVPLFIRGPGIPAGSRVHQLVGIHDLAPTILAMSAISDTHGGTVFDGINLMPMVGDPYYYADRPIVIEGAPPNGETSPDWLFRGVVNPDWKYVLRSNGASELYDRKNDPWELQNLAKDSRYAATLSQMNQLQLRLQSCRGADCLQ
jgi:N-acetylglucosamine-6-sulfatase